MSRIETAVTRVAEPRTVRAARAGRKLNRAEATALTQQIRATAGSLWQLVAVAYDRKAWQALGYSSWKDYATEELQMSESRSYQLIDTGRVMKAIGDVVGDVSVLESVTVTARETAKVKPHLSLFQRELKKAIKDGVDPEEAVQQVITSLPTREKVERGPRQPKVVEGEVVSDEQPEQNDLLAAYEAEQEARRKRGRAVVLDPFSGKTETTIPKGRSICATCNGAGYV